MKGLLLAGGHGTRLRPLTYTGNKHMLPIANKPMLLYGLEHLRNAGIEEIGIILGPVSEGVVELLGDGSKFGVRLTYINQPEPKGLAHAVQISENFMGGDSFVMYLGDNLLKQGVSDFVGTFKQKKLDCLVGVCPVDDPSRFGVAEMKGNKIVRLVEKPKEPKSNLALIGVYVFGPLIFKAVKRIKPSWRNELEITDAIQMMLSLGMRVEAQPVTGWWKDTGKPEDLLEANQLVLSDIKSSDGDRIPKNVKVAGSASIGKRTRFAAHVDMLGPLVIGEGCQIGPNVRLGPYTSIGNDCRISDVEIDNSIIMEGSTIEGAQRIVDSLIGGNSTIVGRKGEQPKGNKFILGERSYAQM
jgi:glucose-1-phosphate thymidylyltransferase